MNATYQNIKATLDRLAPTWPLDRQIAVNPFFNFRDLPFVETACLIETMTGIQCLPKGKDYSEWLAKGYLTVNEIEVLIEKQNIANNAQELIEYWQQGGSELKRWKYLSLFYDDFRPINKMLWSEEISHQVSQFCAYYFQNQLFKNDLNLYGLWLQNLKEDKGIEVVLGAKGLAQFIDKLPNEANQLIELAIRELAIESEVIDKVTLAYQYDLNGWASHIAWQKFEHALYDKEVDLAKDLLAIRWAWDLLLHQYHESLEKDIFIKVSAKWHHQNNYLNSWLKDNLKNLKLDILGLEAAELNYQNEILASLNIRPKQPNKKPELQAVFCIDVRSETLRKNLEEQDASVQTFGFAGFFGLPIDFQAPGLPSTPQLPGLLKPTLKVTLSKDAVAKASLIDTASFKNWSKGSVSSFSMVESCGLLFAQKMFKKSKSNSTLDLLPFDDQVKFKVSKNEKELRNEEIAEICANVLNAMSLKIFAPKVLLVGHGSYTPNNLHAAGLECGACGGQSGWVNVVLLSQWLNNSEVKALLKTHNIEIPEETVFIAALHHTVSDEILYFSKSLSDQQKEWIKKATTLTQQQRAGSILNPKTIGQELNKKANDWSNLQPEWGLAGNASFIIGSREWTKSIDLKGRSFLHEYHYDNDQKGLLLEKIMTAPMVVTQWINMQYYASVVDPLKWGSGNKILHNAVGGNIGVFEGSGGDLRIGLAKQSIHDGQNWRHLPLRLSVFIDAPLDLVKAILDQHLMLKELVENDWIHIFALDDRENLDKVKLS